jgi:hypothetical protein
VVLCGFFNLKKNIMKTWSDLSDYLLGKIEKADDEKSKSLR